MNKIFKNLILVISFMSLVVAQNTQAQVTSVNTINASPSTNSAVLYGSVNPNGYSTTVWFEYSTDSNMYYVNETEHTMVDPNYFSSNFSESIGGLSPNTTYYFRAVADNTRNTTKGNVMYFVTSPEVIQIVNPPQVTTNTNYVINETKYIDRVIPVTIHTQRTTVNTNKTISSVAFQEEETPVTTTDETMDNANVASPLFGSGFMPSNFIEWFIVVLILLFMIAVGRRIVQY